MTSLEELAAQGVRFRQMQLEDVEQVYVIDVLSFSLPWSARSYRYEVTENQASRDWVAEAVNAQGHAQIVGMIVVWVILDEAHVATIAVHPDYRRHGIGKQLLAAALLDALDSGITQSLLEVRRGNQTALAIYEQFGYEVVGVRPGYYADNHEDALLMTLNPIRPDILRRFAPPDGRGNPAPTKR